MRHHKFDRLPEPFRPKATLPDPLVMQLVVVAGEDGGGSDKVVLLKHVIFDVMQKTSIVKTILQGVGQVFSFGGNSRGGPKGFQYMLDRLGGHQVRCYNFEEGVAERRKSSSEIGDAYDFILACGPRQEGRQLSQSRWVK
jgi:hypothetical protein